MKKYIAVFLLFCILLSSCAESSEVPETMTAAPEDERTSITLAVFGYGYDELTNSAAQLNRSKYASDFRIDVVDYCDGGVNIEQAIL